MLILHCTPCFNWMRKTETEEREPKEAKLDEAEEKSIVRTGAVEALREGSYIESGGAGDSSEGGDEAIDTRYEVEVGGRSGRFLNGADVSGKSWRMSKERELVTAAHAIAIMRP